MKVLWAGNIVLDHALRYTGANNDRDPSFPGSEARSLLPLNGYFLEDINMDGTVKYGIRQ